MKIIKVGRSRENDIVIQNDPYVGRTHCQFIMDDNGDYRVIDLNSSNGTFVNGVRRSGETRLKITDTVRIGNQNLPWQNYFNGRGTTFVGKTTLDPYPPIPPVPPQSGKGFAVTSMVCGIVGIFFLGIVLGIVAIIFGGIALARHTRGKGMAITGLVLGIIDVTITIVVLIVAGTFGLGLLSVLG